MLSDGVVEANIPAADLGRARGFYADVLGMTPTDVMEGVWLRYTTSGGTRFNVYETQYAGLAKHTVAQWHVTDLDAEVEALTGKGVHFEVYDDLPGVQWSGVIASAPGMGRAAWFTDSEGNILCIDEEEARPASP
jgi:predicted enzyme related to lactoylglutathione lyase